MVPRVPDNSVLTVLTTGLDFGGGVGSYKISGVGEEVGRVGPLQYKRVK